MSGRRAPSLPALALALAVTAAACGEDLTVTPVRNLERPSDLDFVCLAAFPNAGPGGEVVASGQPMSECYLTSAVAGVDGGLGSMVGTSNRITFGLFTNTARSEVGAINMLPDNLGGDRLVDLDRRQPGFNMVPVGTLPERLVASDDGCKTVTANRGILRPVGHRQQPPAGRQHRGRVVHWRRGDRAPPAHPHRRRAAVLGRAGRAGHRPPRRLQPAAPPAPPPDGGTGTADAAADAPADAEATDASPTDATPSDAGSPTAGRRGHRCPAGGGHVCRRAGWPDAGAGGAERLGCTRRWSRSPDATWWR